MTLKDWEVYISSEKMDEHDLSKDVRTKSCGEDLEDYALSNLATSAGETYMKVESGWPLTVASGVGHNGDIMASLALILL